MSAAASKALTNEFPRRDAAVPLLKTFRATFETRSLSSHQLQTPNAKLAADVCSFSGAWILDLGSLSPPKSTQAHLQTPFPANHRLLTCRYFAPTSRWNVPVRAPANAAVVRAVPAFDRDEGRDSGPFSFGRQRYPLLDAEPPPFLEASLHPRGCRDLVAPHCRAQIRPDVYVAAQPASPLLRRSYR